MSLPLGIVADEQFKEVPHSSLGTALLVVASDSESSSKLESEKNELLLMMIIDITVETGMNRRERDCFSSGSIGGSLNHCTRFK